MLECFRNLLIVANLADLPVGVVSTIRVGAANNVVELRGCKKLVVSILASSGIKGINESSNKGRAGRTCIAGKYNPSTGKSTKEE